MGKLFTHVPVARAQSGKKEVPVWSEDRDAEGAEGEGWGIGKGYPPPQPTMGVWGSVVSFPSGIRSGAPVENGFGVFWGR